MSAKYSAVVVVFKEDIDEESVNRLALAFQMFEGVAGVVPQERDLATLIASTRVDAEWRDRLVQLAYPKDSN